MLKNDLKGKNSKLIRGALNKTQYRENMSSHFLFGTHERIAKHQKDYKDKA